MPSVLTFSFFFSLINMGVFQYTSCLFVSGSYWIIYVSSHMIIFFYKLLHWQPIRDVSINLSPYTFCSLNELFRKIQGRTEIILTSKDMIQGFVNLWMRKLIMYLLRFSWLHGHLSMDLKSILEMVQQMFKKYFEEIHQDCDVFIIHPLWIQ